MKATSIFGGVQFFNILVTIIRSKFVAIFIGPAGMGIVGLLKSTIDLVAKISNVGLSVSAIKNVAEANASNEILKVSKTVAVLRRLVWITGLVGTLVIFFTSSWLSSITFNNTDFSVAFKVVSITILLGQISNGQMIVLQGLRKISYLAQANMVGSILGLIITIPLYYYYGKEGIVPVLVLTSAITLLVSYFYSNKIKLPLIKITKKDVLTEGKLMASMGFVISISSFLTLLESYLVRLYISNTGDVADVGFYNAGFTIIGTYVGMIFTAMSTDYYPRLSEVSSNNNKVKEIVNQQAEISILIITPILLVFFVFVEWAVIFLYSKEFLPIIDMVHWACLGLFFKVPTWAIGFVFLAKGDTKWFFLNELIAILYALIFNIIGYTYFGLEGLGISFLIAYILAFIQNLIIVKYLYKFRFTRIFIIVFANSFLTGVLGFLLTYYTEGIYLYSLGTILIVISFVYSYNQLNKRLDIKDLIEKAKHKFLKNK